MTPELHDENIAGGSSSSINGLKNNCGIRRNVRSCDVCRKRKVRCDGERTTNARCTTCSSLDADCTYMVAVKPRPPTVGTRIRQLKEREQRLEKMLQNCLPGVDLSGDIDLDVLAAQVRLPDLPPFQYCRRSNECWDVQPPKDEGTLITVDRPTAPAFLKGHFFGKSSQAVLVKSVLDWRDHDQNGGNGDELELEGRQNLKMWDLLAQRLGKKKVQVWEEGIISPPPVRPSNCSFPEEGLMTSLIDLYFDHVNLFNPLLHRPTFDRLLHENMHVKDASLAEVVLLVCANGARFSDDQRVFLDDTTLSAGYMWFKQAQEIDERLLAPASLYNIQASFLRAEFLRGANPSQRAWSVLGIGLRRAQDVGAHRWQTFGAEKSAERELWTRAWWCLVVLDRVASAILGRPCVTDGWDFDVGLPTECDDEFWNHPDSEKCWKQPNGVPSKVSFFISHIKQTTILARAQRILYSIDNTRRTYMIEIFPDFDRQVVTELDSALNQWISDIPSHLRNPHSQTDPMFHRQSIVLHAELYFLQNLMHRPFMMNPDQKNTSMTATSIAICTNAARACSRLLDTQDQSCRHAVYRIHWPIFLSAVMLLLRVWTGKRMGLQGLYAKEMENVKKCLTMLSYSERCWQSSGQLVDIINSLVDASDLVLPGSDQSSRGPKLNSNPSAQQHNQAEPFQNDTPMYTEDLAKILVYSTLSPHSSSDAQTRSVPNFSSDNQTFTTEQFSPFGGDTSGDGLFSYPPQEDPFSYQTNQAPLDSQASDPFAGLDDTLMLPDMFDPDTLAVLNSTPFAYFGDWGTFVDNVNEAQMSSNMGSMRMA